MKQVSRNELCRRMRVRRDRFGRSLLLLIACGLFVSVSINATAPALSTETKSAGPDAPVSNAKTSDAGAQAEVSDYPQVVAAKSFSADANSKWDLENGVYKLHSGKFKISGTTRAEIFDGIVLAEGNSIVIAHGKSIVEAANCAAVDAFDTSLVRIKFNQAEPSMKVTLHDRANMIDNSTVMSGGIFVDERTRPEAAGKVAIVTSSKELPYVGTYMLYDRKGTFAKTYDRISGNMFGVDSGIKVHGRPWFNGNAFLVSDRKLATAGHVVKRHPPNDLFKLLGPDGKIYEAKVCDVDEQHDLALLELTSPFKGTAHIAELADLSTIPKGEDLIMVGRPGAYPFPQAYPGKFLGERRLDELGSQISTLSGKTVGLLVRGYTDKSTINDVSGLPEDRAIGVRSTDIINLLNRHEH